MRSNLKTTTKHTSNTNLTGKEITLLELRYKRDNSFSASRRREMQTATVWAL